MPRCCPRLIRARIRSWPSVEKQPWSQTAGKSAQRKGFGALLGGVFHAPYPNPYRRAPGQTVEECAMDSIRFIEDQLFRALVAPEEVAAIFVEPVQGEGGYVVPPKLF